MNKTIEQERAQYALEKVKKITANQKEYKSCATQFPVMIQQNGLGQACAFYLSKGGAHEDLYKTLAGWLCKENQVYKGYKKGDKNELLEAITLSDQQKYRIAQAEAQALLFWVAKFAKAYLSDEEEG